MHRKKKCFLVLISLGFLIVPQLGMAGERFIDNGDGTVTDQILGLMWSRTDNQGDVDWKGGERWAKYTFPYTIPPEKRKGWRLPNLSELRSLFVVSDKNGGYESECGQKVRIVSEIRISCGWVWTSDKRSITAKVFNFERGYSFTDRLVKKRAYRALAVRTLKAEN